MIGKRWSFEEKKKLFGLVQAKKPISVLIEALGNSRGAIYAKLDELRLKSEVETKKTRKSSVSITSSQLLPKETYER